MIASRCDCLQMINLNKVFKSLDLEHDIAVGNLNVDTFRIG